MDIGESYYFITDKGTIGKSIWFNNKRDNFRVKNNNVFKDFINVKQVLSGVR